MIYPTDHARRFVLARDDDVTGISGTGIVAEGVIFRDGVGCLRWLTEWPTSVVFYDRGLESIEAIHGHGGKTRRLPLPGLERCRGTGAAWRREWSRRDSNPRPLPCHGSAQPD